MAGNYFYDANSVQKTRKVYGDKKFINWADTRMNKSPDSPMNKLKRGMMGG